MPPRKQTTPSALRDALRDVLEGHRGVANQLEGIGDGGKARRELDAQLTAIASGAAVRVSGFDLSTALWRVGATGRECRDVELRGTVTVQADGCYTTD